MDELAAPTTAPTPAPSPSLTQQEIEALIERKAQEISDKRVAGLMSANDKKLAELNKELQKVRRQALGEPDIEDPEESDAARENAELKRQLAIMQAAQKYEKAGPVYQQLMGFETAEEQIGFLEQWASQLQAPPPPPAATPPAEPDQDIEVPDIDLNRPAPDQTQGFAVYDGVRMNDEIAKSIFDSVTTWPRR